MQKEKVIVICGPTASGKTALSIELAKQINGEIVSADSMQIYKDMDIGTAKPTKEEMQGIKHYLIDFVSPDERYSVADYKQDAKKAIREILKKGKVPIIVGGTGLYVDSLIYEIEYPNIEFDEEYRKKLEKEAEENGLEELYEKAKEIDNEAIQKISKNDKKRILRILEIYHATGKNKTEQEIESRKKEEAMVFTNDKPIYIQMVDRLMDEILADKYTDDERIPSVREYAVLLEVNSNTAVKAYDELARANIIYNKRGLGYFVTPGAKKQIMTERKKEFMKERLPELFRQMKLLGITLEDVKVAYDTQQ